MNSYVDHVFLIGGPENMDATIKWFLLIVTLYINLKSFLGDVIQPSESLSDCNVSTSTALNEAQARWTWRHEFFDWSISSPAKKKDKMIIPLKRLVAFIGITSFSTAREIVCI